LAWPVVLEQALFTLAILADVYIVSRLGASALTGVGLAGQVLLVPTAVVSAVGVGTTALVARQTGAGTWQGAADLAAQAMLLAVGLGSVCAIVLTIWARPILSLSGADPAVVTEGVRWLQVAAPAFVLRSLMSAGGAALRGSGDMRTPMVVHIAVTLLNLGVAWTLTQGRFGLPRLGVLGNALVTATEQTVGGLTILAVYLLPRARLRLRLHLLRLQPTHLRHILGVGLPAGAEQIFFQAALAALLGLIGQLGTEAFTAHQVVLRLSF
jgi:putative MATE family efflux protein